jgi:hypothetical protein
MATAEQIVEARQENKSWAVLATELGLGSPGNARKTYTALTGKHHNDIPGVAVKVQRSKAPKESKAKGEPATNGITRSKKARAFGDKRTYAPAAQPPADVNPHWGPDSDQETIIARLEPIVKETDKGKRYNAYEPRLVVERHTFYEEIKVGFLIGLAYEQDDAVLAVHFREAGSGNFRAVDVAKIVEVQ